MLIMNELPTATRQETLETFLKDAKRTALPLRNTFVQKGTQRRPRPGPLADIVRSGSDRILELYLIAHAIAAKRPFNVARDARVWGRMVGMPETASTSSSVSKAWRWLEEHDLVLVGRAGRLADVTILRDDGSGKKYTHPSKTGERYFKLPFDYWFDGWNERLSVPAKAMLLVALSLQDDFPLPGAKAAPWYGISEATAERGLRELRRADVLNSRFEYKVAPRAPSGRTRQRYYTLRPPFGPKGRRSASAGTARSRLRPSARSASSSA